MTTKYCFLPQSDVFKVCTSTCMAYVEDGKTNCRLLNVFERLVPAPSRPTAPPPPKARP